MLGNLIPAGTGKTGAINIIAKGKETVETEY